jgi:DNA-binding transcriptional LysR family regulator
MSQSAISASITELERALGSDLCVRRRAQGVFLTPMGKLVLPRAGRLHPHVAVDFMDGAQDQLEAALLAGEIDAAVLYDMGHLEAFDQIVLYEARGYALLGESHPLAGRPTVTLEQLATEPLVLFDQPPSASYAMSLFQARGLTPNVRHRTHAFELTRSMVARGIGYAILIQRPENKLSYEGFPILEKEFNPPLPICPVVLAWPRSGRLSPRVHALAELAADIFG